VRKNNKQSSDVLARTGRPDLHRQETTGPPKPLPLRLDLDVEKQMNKQKTNHITDVWREISSDPVSRDVPYD
jgi:hypothetical protein